MPVIEGIDSSTDMQYGVICAGNMVGASFFVLDSLRALIFFRGAKTDRNVGIGSRLRELRAAYGKRLRQVTEGFETAYQVTADQGPRPRPAIQFNLLSGRVSAVQYGTIDGLSANYLFRNLYIHNVTC